MDLAEQKQRGILNGEQASLPMRFIYQTMLAVFVIFMMTTASAQNAAQLRIIPPYSMQQYDSVITQIYHNSAMREFNKSKRLLFTSQLFINKPYLLGALGEGAGAPFDQSPLYRTDAFDCMTFVSTVLALVNANNLTEFQQALRKINYQDEKINYLNRNHFTSVDWNAHNANNGYIRDVTTHIVDRQGHPVAKHTHIMINKKDWYRKKNLNTMAFLQPVQPSQEAALLQQLKQLSTQVKNQTIAIHYIPLTTLFDAKGNPNAFLFNQIPNGSIVELVTPHWDRRQDLGTFIDIAHLGFVFHTDEGLIFRDASESHGKVQDNSLIAYLRHFMNSPTIKGINIQEIR